MKQKLLLVITFLFITSFLVGCQKDEKVTVMDREGNEVVLTGKVEKIISTAPSNTEVLVGLGMADHIIAVDNYSPVEDLKEDIVKIDFQNPDAETIIGLQPDIIIASEHNRTGSEDPFLLIKEAGIPVVYIPSSISIEGIYKDIDFIGQLTDKVEEANTMKETMKQEIEKIRTIASQIKEPKRVYFEISPVPSIYTPGQSTFQNEILEVVGAINVFGEETGWISPSPEAIVEKNPQVIITNVSYIQGPVEEILGRTEFQEIDAIKEKKVYQIDANTSSRPSQHVVKALKEVAKALYPEYYE